MKAKFLGFRATEQEMKRIRETSNKLNFATVSAFMRKVVFDFIDTYSQKKKQ